MPLARKNPINPLLPNDMRGKSGTLLRGNNVYNGTSRAPNPRGKNQHNQSINNLAKKRMALNKAKLKKRIL